MRSYRPEELFDEDGRPAPDIVAFAPEGNRRMGASPHANGGVLTRDLDLPDFRTYGVEVPAPGQPDRRTHPRARPVAARRHGRQRQDPQLPGRRSRRDGVQSARGAVRGHRARRGRRPILDTDENLSVDGRVMEILSETTCPGMAGGVPADRSARAVQLLRGVHPHRRLHVQSARQVARGELAAAVAPARSVADLSAVVPRLAPGPQRVLASGPGLHRPRRQQAGLRGACLPAAGHQLPAVGGRPLPAQSQLRQRHRGRQAAGAVVAHHGRGGAPLHQGDRHLGVGLGRPRRRREPRRGARLLRGHSHAGDTRGGLAC